MPAVSSPWMAPTTSTLRAAGDRRPPPPRSSVPAPNAPGAPGGARRTLDAAGGLRMVQPPAIDLHRGVPEVAVRLVRQRRHALVVVRAGEALVVADHVTRPDRVVRLQPARQPQRGSQLAAVAHHVRVGGADVLYPDRRPVEAHGVPAHQTQRHELVNHAPPVDHEVRTHPRKLVQLRIGHVARERLVGGPVAAAARVVLARSRADVAAGTSRGRSGARRNGASRACAGPETGCGSGRSPAGSRRWAPEPCPTRRAGRPPLRSPPRAPRAP